MSSSSVRPESADPEVNKTSKHKKSVPFWAKVIVGLVVGVILGFAAKLFQLDWLATILETVGTTFVTLLKVVVVPLVLTAIIVSIANLRQVANAARLAVQTLIWFAITAAVSVGIGLTIGLLTNPGSHADLSTEGAKASSTQGGWLDFLDSVVPSNILGLGASESDGEIGLSFNVLQLVVIGIAIGAAALSVGQKSEPFLNFTRSTLEIFQKLTWWIILLAPIGSAGLIGKAVATYGWDLVAPLGIFTLDVYIGCLLVMFGLYPLVLKAHGLRIGRFYAGAWEAIQFGFVSRSSVGTLPLTQHATTKKLGVAEEYASFAVPIGSTTKMDGCAAIYPALAAITVAQLFGVPLGITDYLLIAFVSVVGSAATAGLTGAVVMLTLTLSTLGLPLEGVGLLLAIDPILDMIRTATNVTGQMVVPVIVAKRNNLLDLDVYNGKVDGEAKAAAVERDREPALAN